MTRVYTNTQNNKSYFSADYNTKINLHKGIKAFEDCIEFLNSESISTPLQPLEMVDELKIPFPEERPELANTKEYMTKLFIDLTKDAKEKYTITAFHYDNNILIQKFQHYFK